MTKPGSIVTVVIPAYNAARLIGATLDSILGQSFKAFTVIVVDDCSTDHTEGLIASYCARDPRVKYHRMPGNTGGPAAPRNVGVALAASEWVAFCDADDVWHPNKLNRQIEAAASVDASLLSTAIIYFEGDFQPVESESSTSPLGVDRISLGRMVVKNAIATSSVLCRRDSVIAVGGFCEDRDLVAVEDYDLWLRIMEWSGKPAVRIRDHLVYYRVVPGSISSSKFAMLRKVLRVVGRYYARRGAGWLIYPLAPFHLAAHGLGAMAMRLASARSRATRSSSD